MRANAGELFWGEVVTSRQNPTVKRVCALLEKKARRREGLFRFDGIKLLCEAVKKRLQIELVVINEALEPSVKLRISELIGADGIDLGRVLCVSSQVFERISEEASPEGIITVAKIPARIHSRVDNAGDYFAEGRLLIVEAMRDPGNLGTVIRSASALGIDRLIISDDCADLYNPRTVRAAMGALFSLRIDTVETEALPTLIKSLRASGREIYAAALTEDARKINEIRLREGDAFVIGNEGHGLSEAVIEASSGAVIIPMTEGSESLNAAAAAAICIWETVRA